MHGCWYLSLFVFRFVHYKEEDAASMAIGQFDGWPLGKHNLKVQSGNDRRRAHGRGGYQPQHRNNTGV